MKPFLTPTLILQLRTLGKQEFADDPKIFVKITNPGDNTTFFITGYIPDEDMLFGYIIGDNIKGHWGKFPVDGIEYLHQLLQERNYPNQMEVLEPTPISEFFPEMKEAMVVAKLDGMRRELKEELDKDEKGPEQDQLS